VNNLCGRELRCNETNSWSKILFSFVADNRKQSEDGYRQGKMRFARQRNAKVHAIASNSSSIEQSQMLKGKERSFSLAVRRLRDEKQVEKSSSASYERKQEAVKRIHFLLNNL
jgi:hypothetical protein